MSHPIMSLTVGSVYELKETGVTYRYAGSKSSNNTTILPPYKLHSFKNLETGVIEEFVDIDGFLPVGVRPRTC